MITKHLIASHKILLRRTIIFLFFPFLTAVKPTVTVPVAKGNPGIKTQGFVRRV